jgi:hypothetical protein
VAYQIPTPTTFKARYPEFAVVSDTLVGLVLNEAIAQVGETWLERDRARAQMLLAAHNLTIEGEPERSKTGHASAGTGNVKRIKVGDVETEFASRSSSSGGSIGPHGETSYGQQFAALMRMNFGGVVAV